MKKSRVFGQTERELREQEEQVRQKDGFLSEEGRSIWEEEKGQEIKPFPVPIDITDYIGTVFKVSYKSSKSINYEYQGEQRSSLVHLVTLLDTDNPTLTYLKGQDISIFGKGFLDYVLKNTGIKEGDKFLVMCVGQVEIKGGLKPYQFRIKRIV
jgi:hypothetical protein